MRSLQANEVQNSKCKMQNYWNGVAIIENIIFSFDVSNFSLIKIFTLYQSERSDPIILHFAFLHFALLRFDSSSVKP